MQSENISFRNNWNQTLHGRLYGGNVAAKDVVVFSHGLFSSKDAYKITSLAADIVAAGFHLLTFDFSFINDRGGDFSRFSILQEVEDLRCAVNFMLKRGIENVHLIGSSMGGLVSLIFTSENHPAVISLSLIATPFKINEMLCRWTGLSALNTLPGDGTTPIEGISFPNSFYKEALSLDMYERAGRIKIPLLILHGDRDIVVTPDNARALHESTEANSRLSIIEGGDHNLTRADHLDILKKNLIPWLEKNRDARV
jgi:uncharacterized protein